MPKDRYLDVFLFCSILGDDEPSVEKERTYRKFIGAALDDSQVVNGVTNSYSFKDELLGLTLKAILCDYSSSVYSSFWSSNKELFLNSVFGSPPDLGVEQYQPTDEERALLYKIFYSALYHFSLKFNPRHQNYKYDFEPTSCLLDLFYLSPKLMKTTIQNKEIGEDRAQQIIYSLFYNSATQFFGINRFEDFVAPEEFIEMIASYNSKREEVPFENYKKWLSQKPKEECEEYLHKASSVLNNNYFQELVYSTFYSISKGFSSYSSIKNTGFRRLSVVLESGRYTDELLDAQVVSLGNILSSNYHSPISFTHPIFDMVFKNRRAKFDDMVNYGLIQRKYDNPIRTTIYNFCIKNGLFNQALAKALIRETSSSVVENVYDNLFFKNRNADGIKIVQRNTTEEQFSEILSCLAETKHYPALRYFAQGAPLKYLTRIIGKDEHADRFINQRFEAGK